MTVPMTEHVTGTDTGKAQEVVAEKAEEHTPEEVKPVVVEERHNPVSADEKIDALTDVVAGIAGTVDTLVNALAGTVNKDESPRSKVPWTHRGNRHEQPESD